jgi:hypothetical protein
MQITTNIDIKCSLCGKDVPTEEMIRFDQVSRRYTLMVMPCECLANRFFIHDRYQVIDPKNKERA